MPPPRSRASAPAAAGAVPIQIAECDRPAGGRGSAPPPTAPVMVLIPFSCASNQYTGIANVRWRGISHLQGPANSRVAWIVHPMSEGIQQMYVPGWDRRSLFVVCQPACFSVARQTTKSDGLWARDIKVDGSEAPNPSRDREGAHGCHGVSQRSPAPRGPRPGSLWEYGVLQDSCDWRPFGQITSLLCRTQ